MKIVFAFLFGVLFSGCASYEKLPAQQPADFVRITTLAGFPELPLKEIRGKDQITMLVSFVNSLPNKWSVPSYGSPVGQVYFEFFADQRLVGNFYVGTFFFGRDAGNFWSQSTDKARIEQLGKIVDLDLWAYLNAKKP